MYLKYLNTYTLRGSKWNLYTAGHYARPDAFELTVRKRSAPIIIEEEDVENNS